MARSFARRFSRLDASSQSRMRVRRLTSGRPAHGLRRGFAEDIRPQIMDGDLAASGGLDRAAVMGRNGAAPLHPLVDGLRLHADGAGQGGLSTLELFNHMGNNAHG